MRASQSSTKLWQTAHTIIGSNSNNPLLKLYTKFPDCHSAATAVNRFLANVFQSEDYVTTDLPNRSGADIYHSDCAWNFYVSAYCI